MNRIWKLLAVAVAVAAIAFGVMALTGSPVSKAPDSTDDESSLTINPVAAGGSVRAVFSSAHRVDNRPVVLQQEAEADSWETVPGTTAAKMMSDGSATFVFEPDESKTYRAVAQPYGSVNTAVTTNGARSNWTLAKNYEFEDGDPNNADWVTRRPGVYSRKCAAVWEENTSIGDGQAVMRAAVDPKAENIAAAREAGCENPSVYTNAARATETTFYFPQGIVAAKIKFPTNRGIHGGVWLQSWTGPEIDMVESYGSYFTNGHHPKDANGVTVKTPTDYKGKRNKEWYEKAHVFSAEFDQSKIVFRVDGEVTKEVAVESPADAQYFLLMTWGSADWELKNLKDSELPAEVAVDWVKVWTPKA